jgi:DNA-directed RNA polymerase specialized sigma24 family protein
MASNPPPETCQFNRDVQFLLKPNNPHARSLLAFIHRTLRQFGLESYITEVDVFVEAYLRGVNYTRQSGERILQSRAWLRKTAYNIIREWQRDRARYCNAAFDELLEQGVAGHHEDRPAGDLERDSVWVEDEIRSVLQAFKGLEECDRALIQWKVLENLPWQTIQDRLVAQGEERVSLPALRKRGQRALERLRQNYHQPHADAENPSEPDGF